MILGGSGFLGKSLGRKLASGGCEVKCFSSSQVDLRDRECLEYLQGEVDSSTNLVVAAGVISPKYFDDIDNYAANSEIAISIARLIKLTRVRKCTYFGSISVYGDNATNTEITEETPVDPVTNYAVGKYSGERAIRLAAQSSDVPFLGLRICRVFGPEAKDHFYGPSRFVRSIVEDQKVELFGDGSELRELIFIDDFVRISEYLVSSEHTGIFNIGSGNEKPFNYMVEVLKRFSSDPVEVICKPRSRPKIDIRYDITKLKRTIQDLEFASLDDGLAATFRSYKGNLVSVKKSLNR